MTQTKKLEISADAVKALLKEGYARYKKQDKGFGNIQEKLGLTRAQVKKLFLDSRLKGLKTKLPSPDDIMIVD